MNPVRPQNTPESPTLLNDLKAEVSAESAPLLQFIVRNSGLIVGVVVVLLVALVGTAVWRWHQGGLQAEAQTELARIGITRAGIASRRWTTWQPKLPRTCVTASI